MELGEEADLVMQIAPLGLLLFAFLSEYRTRALLLLHPENTGNSEKK